MWKRLLPALLPLALLLALPLYLRPAPEDGSGSSDPGKPDSLIIVTPHTEQIRYEIDRAFRRYYREKYGRSVEIDWRNVGGTADIVRYIADRFEAQFRMKFEEAGGKWTKETASAFKDPKADPSKCPERKMFLESDTGIGIDVFFGGGSYASSSGDPVKPAGSLVFDVGYNKGGGMSYNGTVGRDSIAIYALRPDTSGNLTATKVGDTAKPTDKMKSR